MVINFLDGARTRKYPTFYAPFVWASFSTTVFGGFLLAVLLSVAMSSSWWSGAPLYEIVQLHGHLQLVAWMGMLLLGVSLYMLPRLMSVSKDVENVTRWIFFLLFIGILLRTAAVLLGVASPNFSGKAGNVLLLGAIFEFVGIAFYLFTCMKLILGAKGGNNDLSRLWPYFFAMFLGWSLFAIGQLWLSFSPSGVSSVLLNQEWSSFLTDLFVRLVLIPAIFGFGVKLLPVFLGLTPPLWPARNVGVALLVSTTTYIAGKGLFIIAPINQIFRVIQCVGLLGMSVSVLTFIWYMDVLLFRILPERIVLKAQRSDVKEQRGRFGDKGEYGRFELFIVVGFAWLTVVAILESVNSLRILSGYSEIISHTTLRHGLLLGALAHIVLGVSHRLLPNLIGRKLRSPWFTGVAFVLLFIASILRIVPLAVAELGFSLPMIYFSWSGVLGFLAVFVSFMNIIFPVNTR